MAAEGQPGLAADRRVLRWSLAASAVVGAGALIWGVLAGADVIVFDGVYTLAGIALSVGSLLAARAADAPPSREFPFGMSAAVPAAVVVQGGALAATLVYAAATSVQTVVDGGSDTSQGVLIVYGAVSGLVALLVARLLGRLQAASDLATAEIVGWRAGAVLSLVVVGGGAVGLVLVRTGHAGAAAYVDPVLVLVGVVLVSGMPVRLVRAGMGELLEGAPPAHVAERVRSAVDGVRAEHGLPAPTMRATKLGRRLYVEATFLVEAGCWDVDTEDAVRRAVIARLDELPFDVWAVVELTADEALAD